jgi:hypothetical protein
MISALILGAIANVALLVRGQSPGQPDGLHFHMMIFERVVRWRVGSKDPDDRRVRNWRISPYRWVPASFTIALVLMFWDNAFVLACCFFAFVVFYNWLYNRMVTFRVPKWLIIHSHA